MIIEMPEFGAKTLDELAPKAGDVLRCYHAGELYLVTNQRHLVCLRNGYSAPMALYRDRGWANVTAQVKVTG